MSVPSKGEKEKDFISRYIVSAKAVEDFPDLKLRVDNAYMVFDDWEKEYASNSNELTYHTFNLKNTAPLTKTVVAGRTIYIAPVVMMAEEGVMNRLLYTGEATRNSVPSWNGRHFLVFHPDAPGSANSPETFAQQEIGVIFNSHLDGGFLKAEVHIDAEKAAAIPAGKTFIEYLESNRAMDVSTGMRTHKRSEEGVYKGKPYYAVVESFEPDHLAALPGKEGAASWRDGVGFNRNNNIEGKKMKKELLDKLVEGGVIEENKRKEYESATDEMGEVMLALNERFKASEQKTVAQVPAEPKTVIVTKEVSVLSDEQNKLLEFAKNEMSSQRQTESTGILALSQVYTNEDLEKMDLENLKKIHSALKDVAPKEGETNFSANSIAFSLNGEDQKKRDAEDDDYMVNGAKESK